MNKQNEATALSAEVAGLSPFSLGETEVLLVPNQVGGAEPSVLFVAQHQLFRIAKRLTPAQIRRLAAYLLVAAEEADAFSLLWHMPGTEPRIADDTP